MYRLPPPLKKGDLFVGCYHLLRYKCSSQPIDIIWKNLKIIELIQTKP